ncbi:AzlD domain-containing protein [Actinophytocola sp.]|jgi:branched-subunit amino acid transport protein|uniref:AzlD domain-containing protein n=1 Tax=Actinophytocola sp. TaxID=1872138 RepID=UPI002EDADAC2
MVLFTIVLMGAIVFVMRFSFFAVPRAWTMPKVVERALPYVLPAVLLSMLVPGIVLSDDGAARVPIYGPYLIGVVAGFAVGAIKKDNFFLVFGSSVLAFAVAKVVFAQ